MSRPRGLREWAEYVIGAAIVIALFVWVLP